MKSSALTFLPALFVVSAASTNAAFAQCPATDVHEEDDTCATALALSPGTYTDLTLFGGASAGGEDADFFRITVPAGNILQVDCLHDSSIGDIDVYFFDAASATCGGHGSGDYLERGFSSADLEDVAWNNTTGASLDVIVEMDAWDGDSSFACNDYDLTITLTPDPCLAAIDDGFEENDTCAAAVLLPGGTHQGLFVSSDEDYYRIPLGATDQLAFTITYPSAIATLRVELFDDPSCTNVLDSGGWGGSDTLTATNVTGAPLDLYARVFVQSGDCTNYDLDVSVQPDPCQQTGADDAFEDNDDCATATSVAPTGDDFTALYVSTADPDFFAVTLNPQATLTATCLHQSALVDIDIHLFDELSLTNGLCGDTSSGIPLESSSGSGDLETFSWNHLGAVPTTYYVMVDVWSGSGGDCGTYDLEIEVEGGEVAIPFCFGDGSGFGGATVCPCDNHPTPGVSEGCKNSMGHGAKLSAAGSNLVVNDDMLITITQGRPYQPSVLVQGGATISVPFKDGILCAAAPTLLLEYLMLDGTGTGTTTVPVAGAGGASPGSIHYYQQWYRDPNQSPCGQGSNFSHGLEVRWF